MEKISKNDSDGELKFIQLDCSSLESIKVFVQNFELLDIKIDLLISKYSII
jgi:hypothetical protein